jgi:hypothetical protein
MMTFEQPMSLFLFVKRKTLGRKKNRELTKKETRQ